MARVDSCRLLGRAVARFYRDEGCRLRVHIKGCGMDFRKPVENASGSKRYRFGKVTGLGSTPYGNQICHISDKALEALGNAGEGAKIEFDVYANIGASHASPHRGDEGSVHIQLPKARARRGFGNRIIVDKCPYCGGEHTHLYSPHCGNTRLADCGEGEYELDFTKDEGSRPT